MGGLQEKLLRPFVGKKRYYVFWRKMFRASLMGMNVGNGGGFESSGEKYVMQYVKEHVARQQQPVLFDVGANVGMYAQELLNHFHDPRIHCFEPAEGTFAILSQNIQSPNVTLNHFGLSDACSENVLFFDKEGSGLASLYQRQGVDSSRKETVRLNTLDHYCEEHNISHIDFLKMDIEGNELNALRGGGRMLSDGRIRAIQMEFGGCNIDSRTYFRDFWNLLHEDYEVYRVLIDGLYRIEAYFEILELFTCTNYLFVNKNVAKS